MQHPVLLPLEQRQHLATAIRRHGMARISQTLGVSREPLAKMAAGLPCRAGNVALAQRGLPALDAALDTSAEPPRAA